MPIWARFVSGTVTGAALSLLGVILAAYWWAGLPVMYWSELADFMTEQPFWTLVWQVLALAAATLGVARFMLALGLMQSRLLAGALAGFLAPSVFVLVILFTSMGGRESAGAALFRLGPEILLFTLPFVLSGALTAAFWEQEVPASEG